MVWVLGVLLALSVAANVRLRSRYVLEREERRRWLDYAIAQELAIADAKAALAKVRHQPE